MQTTGFNTYALSSLLSSGISRILKLDSSMTVFLNMYLTPLIAENNLNELLKDITICHIFLVGCIYLIYIYFFDFVDCVKNFKKSNIEKFQLKTRQIEIYNSDQIELFMKYVKNHDFFQSPSTIEISDNNDLNNNDPNKNQNSYYIYQKDGEIIKFNDKNLNIEGHYFWSTKDIEKIIENKIVSKKCRYITIFVTTEYNILNYMDQIKKNVEKINNNKIELFHLQVLSVKGVINSQTIVNGILYQGKKLNMDEREKLYINSFFSEEKDYLWNIIKSVDTDPTYFSSFGQSPKISLLLHGPPGTGKSTFAYRIAMALNRHIYSLDLRDFITKASLYLHFKNPGSINKNIKTNNCVYILDEFDLVIRKANNQIKTDENRDNWCIEDLLELFQGPVPMYQTIIIATTNNFDEIKRICPALVRPGRMTPIYFGYVTKNILQEISKYYFGKKLKIYIPETIKIPTSEIIELALETKINNDFKLFENKLNELLKIDY